MGEVVSLDDRRRAVAIDRNAARMMAAVLDELADYVPAPEQNDVPDDEHTDEPT